MAHMEYGEELGLDSFKMKSSEINPIHFEGKVYEARCLVKSRSGYGNGHTGSKISDDEPEVEEVTPDGLKPISDELKKRIIEEFGLYISKDEWEYMTSR
jgi:hypothetical protein